MDHKGPEHHYDELECPGCGAFFQQGEIQPETVRNNCPECDYDLRSSTGGRPYRGQPAPTVSEMTERNTPLDGASGDRGGNPTQTGILAGFDKDKINWEEIAELDEATEPAGLGETHPVKDNQWKPGDKTDRGMGRDEMLGSVRNSGEHSWSDPEDNNNQELWDQVVKDFENAKAEPHQSTHKVATAPWLDEEPDNFPVEQLGWDIVDIVEPSKELTEAANKYSMPIPEGITDNLHEALIKLNVWVENPEENGKLRPYKQYWSVIRPKIREGSIQIGVEDPYIADIINHVARTDDLSSLNKMSNIQKSSFFPALLGLIPAALETIGLGGAAAATAEGAAAAEGASGLSSLLPSAANTLKGALGKDNLAKATPSAFGTGAGNELGGSDSEDSEDSGDSGGSSAATPEAANPITEGGMTSLYMSKSATYGDEYESPSSITRRIEDPENIDPHQRSDESNDNWAYDMLDVNEIGSTHDPRGKDDAKERIKRQFAANDNSESDKNLEKAFKAFVDNIEDILSFAFSDESGADHPGILSVHDAFESAVPGYLDLASAPEDNAIIIALENEQNKNNKNQKQAVNEFGPTSMIPRGGMPLMPDATLAPEPPKPNVVDPSTHGFDPQSGPASAAGTAAGWETQTSPNLINKTAPLTPEEQQQAQQLTQKNKQQQQQAQQQIMQQVQQKKKGSNTQGPHTNEQQKVFNKHLHKLLEAGKLDEEQVAALEDLMFDSASNPEVVKIWSEIANQDKIFDTAPEDMAPSPQEQMQGMGAPGAPAPPGGDMGMGGPPGPPGAAPGIPDMGAPTPADLNPAGPGAMPPPIMSHVRNDMIKSVLKYAADSAASTCPKCDGHTTGVVNQSSGGCECRSCGHKWDDNNLIPSDGSSTDMSTTAALDQGPMEVMPGSVDSFSEPEELEEDNSTHTWADDNGEPLQEGEEYEIYAHNYEIPDVGRVIEVKPDAIVYEIESNGGLRTTIEIDRKEADLNGYRFVSTGGGSEENLAGIEENMDSKNVTAPGQDSDLSTPHIQIGSSTKNATVGFWACPETPACQFNLEGGDFEPGECPYHHVPTVQADENYMQQIYTIKEYMDERTSSLHKIAGQHYTPMQQRELIDEYGEARNADKLNLEGTHYADSDPDYFLFGC